VDNQKTGQGGEPQTAHTLRQGEPTLYWFLLIHYIWALAVCLIWVSGSPMR